MLAPIGYTTLYGVEAGSFGSGQKPGPLPGGDMPSAGGGPEGGRRVQTHPRGPAGPAPLWEGSDSGGPSCPPRFWPSSCASWTASPGTSMSAWSSVGHVQQRGHNVQYGMDLPNPQLNYDGVSENYAHWSCISSPNSPRWCYSADRHHDPVVPRLLCMLFFLGSAWSLPADDRDLRPGPALVGLGNYLFLPLTDVTAHVNPAGGCALFYYTGGGVRLFGVSAEPGGWPSCGGPHHDRRGHYEKPRWP